MSISPYLQEQAYNSRYNEAVNQQQSNYSNMVGLYGDVVNNIQNTAGQVSQGYGNVLNSVLGQIKGIGASQSQNIEDTYASQKGGLLQRLVSGGLGNNTVMGSMMRGLTLDAQKAHIALANQIAQLTAGYTSQLGGAGLQALMQGSGLAGQLGSHLIGALSGYRFPFPQQPNYVSQQHPAIGGGGGYGGGRPSGGSNEQGIMGPDRNYNQATNLSPYLQGATHGPGFTGGAYQTGNMLDANGRIRQPGGASNVNVGDAEQWGYYTQPGEMVGPMPQGSGYDQSNAAQSGGDINDTGANDMNASGGYSWNDYQQPASENTNFASAGDENDFWNDTGD